MFFTSHQLLYFFFPPKGGEEVKKWMELGR